MKMEKDLINKVEEVEELKKEELEKAKELFNKKDSEFNEENLIKGLNKIIEDQEMIIMGIKISKMKEIENLAKELMQLDLGDIKMMEYSKDELKEVSKSLRNLVNAIKRIK